MPATGGAAAAFKLQSVIVKHSRHFKTEKKESQGLKRQKKIRKNPDFGERRIRTFEGVSQQIYSLAPLGNLPVFPATCQIRTDDPEITSHVLWPAELRWHTRVSFCAGAERTDANHLRRININRFAFFCQPDFRFFFRKQETKNLNKIDFLLDKISEKCILHLSFMRLWYNGYYLSLPS